MLIFRKKVAVIMIMLALAAFLNPGSATGLSGPSARGVDGKIPGVKLWTLPNGPGDSVVPNQCWHAVGSAPDGDIYIAGMDHVNNAGLYKLSTRDDTLYYLGDAKTASQAANNWSDGETAEKFHTRPIWYDNGVFVATTDKTDVGSGYKRTRGFHWYKFDEITEIFSDLSASEPGGVGAPKLQILTIAPDPKNNCLYGIANASGEIVRYDIATRLTTNLGRHPNFDRYTYVNRFMWVDSRGILYFSAGWSGSDPRAVYGHIYTYDPASGFGEKTDFRLNVPQAIECGQWSSDRKHCYMLDHFGNLYRFDDEGPSWTLLGNFGPEASGQLFWSMDLSPDDEVIYAFLSGQGSLPGKKTLFQYDLAANKASVLVDEMSSLFDDTKGYNVVTGYDAWDRQGNFYVANFQPSAPTNVDLVRINPVKVKYAMGAIPCLYEVSASYSPDDGEFVVSRTGGSEAELGVLYQADGMNSDGKVLQTIRGIITIPLQSSNAALPLKSLNMASQAAYTKFTVLGDGNDYVITAPWECVSTPIKNIDPLTIYMAGGSVFIAAIGIALVFRSRKNHRKAEQK